MSFKGSLKLPGWESTQGSKHRLAKLNDDAIRDMRSGQQTAAELAKKYGVSEWTVKDILQRKRWKHVN